MKKLILLCLTLLTATSFAAPLPLQKLTVMLDWFPNPDHAPLIIAKQQGFFKEQGLDVELIGPRDPTDPPKMVAAGKADLAITYEPAYLEQVDQGLPLIRIGTLVDKPLDCLVALKSSGIKTLADLKGKRIGVSGNGLAANVMLKTMLTKQGLSANDVEIINVHYNLTQALLSHKVDAVTGMGRNFEVPQLELNNQKLVVFFPEEHGVPSYSELIFVSQSAHAQDKRFPRFLTAVKKAVKYIDEHPQMAWQQFAALYPDANNALNRQAWFATMPYFAEDPAGFNKKETQHFAQFMQENHLIKTLQPASNPLVALK